MSTVVLGKGLWLLAMLFIGAGSGLASGNGGATASGPASDNRAVLVGPAACRIGVPAGWSPRDVRWSGSCRDGLADGRGVLREFVDGRVARIYYGRLLAGQAALGVIEQPDGYVAGRFEAGRAVRDGDRNTLIDAFAEAKAAAEQVSQGYRQIGNLPSSRFYFEKALQLGRQLD